MIMDYDQINGSSAEAKLSRNLLKFDVIELMKKT